MSEQEEQERPTRAQLRGLLFGRRRNTPPHVVHNGRTTENLGEPTARRKHAKAFKNEQRKERYNR